jgi:hypothetical protein
LPIALLHQQVNKQDLKRNELNNNYVCIGSYTKKDICSCQY